MRRGLRLVHYVWMGLIVSACSFPIASPTPIFPVASEPSGLVTLTPFLPQPAVGEGAAAEVPTLARPPSLPLTISTPEAPTPSATDTLWPEFGGTPQPATLEAYFRRSVLLPVAEAIVRRVNHDRALLGIPGLIAPPVLMEVAFIRAETLVTLDVFSHLDSQGGSPAEVLMVEAGFGGGLGENLFACTDSLGQVAERAVTTWMGSADHRALILDSRYRYTGVGLMGDGTWWKVVQVFAENGP